MVRTNWVGNLIAGVICLLIAYFVPQFLPGTGGSIVSIIGYVAAVILFILAIVALLRGRGV